jgi:hypothetical protein
MASLTGDDRIIQYTIDQYIEMYPSEQAQALIADVDKAVVTVWEAARLILRSRASDADTDDPKILFPVLNSLNDAMKKKADSDIPTRNGFGFGGSLFRSKPDRVATCRNHLTVACREILRTSYRT